MATLTRPRNGLIDDIVADPAVIDRAFDRAYRQACIEHKQAGVPLVFSRDGQVVEIAPEDIVIPPEV